MKGRVAGRVMGRQGSCFMEPIFGVGSNNAKYCKMQIYGHFEGFPLQQCIVWVGNMMTPLEG